VRLEDKTSAVHLDPNASYDLTIAFRDPADNSLVLAQTQRVAGFPPVLSQPAPDASSTVAREALGCPRSVV
jgi:hypothetical protein